jgi:hypothetical protein
MLDWWAPGFFHGLQQNSLILQTVSVIRKFCFNFCKQLLDLGMSILAIRCGHVIYTPRAIGDHYDLLANLQYYIITGV